MARSHNEQRYGKASIPADMTIQDWGVTYDELEPLLRQVRVSVRHLRQGRQPEGQKQPGGNPFEGPRQREYPNPPLRHDLCADPVRQGRAQSSATTRSPHPPRTCRAPTPTRSACSSARAPTAASARSSAAATIRRPARRPPILPVLMRKTELRRCAPTARS